MASNKIRIKLQGHEKFALRDGWLTKGIVFDYNNNSKIFQDNCGPDEFGIGNNMVKSLRYWLRAFSLIKEDSKKGVCLDILGELIKKYDPYLEDIFTIWLLHSNIAKNNEEATSWFLLFNRCDIENLDREQMHKILVREITKYSNGQSFSENSVKTDVDVFLAMYAKNKTLIDPEDKNISPFAVLELIKENDGKYRKCQPDRRIINEWNILYELSYMRLKKGEAIAIEKLAHGDNSIASIYNLSYVTINELLDRLDSKKLVRVDRTAGIDMIYMLDNFTPEEVIEKYYESHK